MAEIVTPSGLVNELTVITDDDTISEVNVPGEAFNRKIKKSVDKTYFQDTLPTEIATNMGDIAGIKNGTVQLNPRSFTSGRFDSQELTSGTLSVAGWYTIAEVETTEAMSYHANFNVVKRGGIRRTSISFRVNFATSNSGAISKIEITGLSEWQLTTIGILGARIAKSDTVLTAGAKIQIELANVSNDVIITQINNNLSFGSESGFILVAPYLDNTPTLPDGVTAGTFLEAGEELSFEVASSAIFVPNWTGLKATNDVLVCSVLWPEIPKQGTGLTVTVPSTNLTAIDGEGISTVITGFSITNFEITGKYVNFRIAQTGAFTSHNAGPIMLAANGTGGKLTIT